VTGFFGFILTFSQGGEPSQQTNQGRVCHWDFLDSRVRFVDLALEFLVHFTVSAFGGKYKNLPIISHFSTIDFNRFSVAMSFTSSK
jgi:hypothetical protein